MGSDAQPPPYGSSGGKPTGGLQQQTTSSSSSMSKFYTPMNPSYVPLQTTTPTPPAYTTTPQQPTQTLPVSGNAQDGVTAPGSTIGPSTALLLANLAATPGFLSNQAIQQAREEYSQRQVSTSSTPQTQSYQPTIQNCHYNPVPAYSPSQPHQEPVNYRSSDPGASIEALLKELHQTTDSSSSPSFMSHPSTAFSPLPAAHTTSGQPSTATPAPLHPKQPSQSVASEDYSSGKITPQLVMRLAALAETDSQEGGTLLSEIKRLRERQMKAERSLFEDRQAIIARHKKDLVKLQANEIMGMDVTKQMKQTKGDHGQELKKFDKHVIRTLDKEIRTAQEALSKIGVPTMSCTDDPAMIASQIKVLRLLEDMLHI
ncbi:hypothetical protein BGX34_008535 [Mortierella sp. NVP85]|nr:hypothetical protein BGX34_008535 [Mortierella sp. NVP85]